jgi:CBS domain-containing protein
MNTVQQLLDRKGVGVSTIERHATALHAAHLMNDLHIGSLVVIEGDKVVGIVTERDILRRVVAAERDPAITPVETIMSTPVACCRPDTQLEECRAVMTGQRLRHLPVVHEGKLFGIVTIGDLLAHEIKEHQITIEYLNEYLYSINARP